MNRQQTIKITKENLEAVLLEQRENFDQKDLGLEREILPRIKSFLSVPHIVIITGLRRAGKSTLLAQLAKKYLKNNYYFINFDDDRLLDFNLKDFSLLDEVLLESFGEQDIYLFDEIQNIPEWERYVRRLHDTGKKIFITGSNASLLSQELGTRLTGRHVNLELYPFSFREYLCFKNQEALLESKISTKQKNYLIKYSNDYLQTGGIPDFLKYQKKEILKHLYENILYRDIVARYNIVGSKNLKELALFLATNVSSLVSFNKLKNNLKLKSSTTVKNYIDYLENAWLFFIVNVFDYSVKRQQIAPKKVYIIDNGLRNTVGFKFSKDTGRLMENVVFLSLRHREKEIFYYKTEQNHEVDFYVRSEKKLIQVSHAFNTNDLKIRETRSLLEAFDELDVDDLIIVTERDKGQINKDGKSIQVVPLYEWLLRE
ncbi:MAG: ATP-binding protein [Chloroflexota bacterium]|nr:ATP-binding protein [Chloroflexota bacterium]